MVRDRAQLRTLRQREWRLRRPHGVYEDKEVVVKSEDGYIGQAQALIALGRHADAVPLLHRAITAEPESSYPRCVLAGCLIDIGRHDHACKMAESAIALSPEFSPAHRMHSLALIELGKGKAALHAAGEA